jgi:mRNA interferase RelE/StbE
VSRYEVVYTPRAERLIRGLDPGVRLLCLEAIRRLAEDPFRGKRLHGELREVFSYRTGDYRILYEIVRGKLRILVLAVGHRRDVYERVKRWLPPT